MRDVKKLHDLPCLGTSPSAKASIPNQDGNGMSRELTPPTRLVPLQVPKPKLIRCMIQVDESPITGSLVSQTGWGFKMYLLGSPIGQQGLGLHLRSNRSNESSIIVSKRT